MMDGKPNTAGETPVVKERPTYRPPSERDALDD